MSSNINVALVAVIALVGVCVAMHADEVGTRDWYRAGLGEVSAAALHPKSKTTKAVYVATKSGTVASLRTRANGELKWRKVFSSEDNFVCVAATESTVFAATVGGKLVGIESQKGAVLRIHDIDTAKLGSVVGCAVGKDGLVFLATATESTVNIVLVSEDGEVEVRNSASVNGVVEGKCSSVYCWVRGASSNVVVPVESKAAAITDGVPAGSIVDAVRNKAIIADVAGKQRTAVVKGTKVETSELVCEQKDVKCSSGFILEESGDDGTAAVVDGNTNAFTIAAKGLKSIDVAVAERRGVAPQLLAARAGKKGEVLVKTSDNTLSFIIGGEVAWSLQEGLSTPAFVKFGELADELIAGATNVTKDPFNFNEIVFVQSRFGRLFALTTQGSGAPLWSVDVLNDVLTKQSKLRASDVATAKFLQLVAVGENVCATVALPSGSGVTLCYEGNTGVLQSTDSYDSVNAFSGSLVIGKDDVANTAAPAGQAHYMYSVDAAAGVVSGYAVEGGKKSVKKSWSVNVGGPVVATADGRNPLAVSTVDSIRVVPNAAKVNQVRRKYPTANVIAVAVLADPEEDEDTGSTLRVFVIDGITGNMLAHGSFAHVDGRVTLLVAEHVVLIHYLDVNKMRFNLASWELVRREKLTITDSTMVTPGQVITSFFTSGAPAPFSSFDADPPEVVSHLLAFPGGEITAMGLTTSHIGVSRKVVVFAFASGRVAALDLRSLLVGGQPNPKKPTEQVSFVALHPTQIVSHINSVMNAAVIATSPTELESSAHVLVAGQDLFYIRLSSGKAFDLLNEDFNFRLLIIITTVFAGLTLVFRQLANQASLKLLWA